MEELLQNTGQHNVEDCDPLETENKQSRSHDGFSLLIGLLSKALVWEEETLAGCGRPAE